MRGFIGFTKRNLMIYFKDIQSVIFSLLTSIIVLALYLLFLKGTFVDAIASLMDGLEGIILPEQTDMLVNGILLTGVTGSALITVPYQCLQTVVKDREQKVDYDILATPLTRSRIILSYFLAAVNSAFLVSAGILTAGLLILSSMGNLCMSLQSVLSAYGTVLLGAVSATSFFMPIMLMFRSASAGAAFFGMLSAASGFVIGAYIPVSQFSEGVQTVCNLFPASHVTILMRNHILNGLLEEIDTSIGGVDGGAFLEGIKEAFTFEASLFGRGMSNMPMAAYVGAISVLCTAIMVFVYRRTYKRK